MTKQKSSILTQPDYSEIRRVVKEELKDYATKVDLKQFATKEDLIAFKLEILGAINKKNENDLAHTMLHENLGDDVPKLQKQVQHLFKTFEIKDPTTVTASY